MVEVSSAAVAREDGVAESWWSDFDVKWRCGEDGGAVVVRVRCENGADSGEECGREVVAPWCAGWMRVTADWWCRGGRRGEEVRRRLPWWWKERRKLGLGFWEMKMMTWQPSIRQLVSARIVATWLALVG
ncbi:hypothetical protein DEO72_LG11g1633 [Vigna unguiculata]|uniref:Uncharacterized protein n=1 Tax=Vigna unguiculata TaxID=3917 RepID=A0A4D6NLF6_VIGUN|nr:hypothetical protein DEO72_LG11g1633 [Vigna unguiculata]